MISNAECGKCQDDKQLDEFMFYLWELKVQHNCQIKLESNKLQVTNIWTNVNTKKCIDKLKSIIINNGWGKLEHNKISFPSNPTIFTCWQLDCDWRLPDMDCKLCVNSNISMFLSHLSSPENYNTEFKASKVIIHTGQIIRKQYKT